MNQSETMLILETNPKFWSCVKVMLKYVLKMVLMLL